MKKLLASFILGLGLLTLAPLSLAQAPATDPAPAAAADAAAPAPAATPAPEAPAPAAAAEQPAAAAAAPAPVPNKGDTAWMMTATLLVVLMMPGLALFYGGLVRSKNMLSVLMQVMVTFSLIMVLWFIYGYSLAFTEGGPFVGGLDRLFMRGIWDNDTGTFANGATFSKGVVIPEVVFAAFQATFAGLTCALIVGAFAERMKFGAVMLFMVLWFTFSYLPIAHMVWFWMGPDAYAAKEVADAMTAKAGQIWQWGALDFAGGTVVHINAAMAGLVGAYMVGRRIGYGKEAMAPHNLALTMTGAALLWIGWFGFNAGSALEANGSAALAFINTLVATAAAVLAWCAGEALMRGKASMLGAASGAVAGLVAITPAAGNVGIAGALVVGIVGGFACLWGVNGLKRLLGADDALDVFGVHGIGGIVGALLTGVFNAPDLGGPGYVADWVTASVVTAADYSIGAQVWVQAKAVLLTVLWSGVVSLVAYKIVDLVMGLRVTEEDEREGLDITTHGETAYNR
ncbi:ammonium transporter [Verminephrobacter eiseniae]|uniref:ammonium transporter n=1 Tax=Verminephrobacter eiseniae TaxID=364317 RepID=UPI002239140B|nr:ammonium transporter [Verminephrobacter eiseniae]MCW5231211.1 ammonium transporter [Verminephrobacter eiseniae]MCW5292942.1 ammonium transporter [Verminephrobacter eiseniae]MCW8185282.1 ammonium transporter [Verminephrobacter eiseniae]MCW8224588.1 ammonium transporter [Verminephrobacter eiseniae]MCW8232290.1 ammonium transporter [Verminephrobacter eiseniae]